MRAPEPPIFYDNSVPNRWSTGDDDARPQGRFARLSPPPQVGSGTASNVVTGETMRPALKKCYRPTHIPRHLITTAAHQSP
jgi:hypothetical protein